MPRAEDREFGRFAVLLCALTSFMCVLPLITESSAEMVLRDTILGGVDVCLLVAQIFVAVFIARLVSLQISGKARP